MWHSSKPLTAPAHLRWLFVLHLLVRVLPSAAVLCAEDPGVVPWKSGPVPGLRFRPLPAVTSPGIAASAGEPAAAGFTPLSSTSTGITFTNLLPESRHLTNQILLNGAGVAAGDVDGDGWCDLFFCGSNGRSALYRNLGGWHFSNVTTEAGVALDGITATGCAFVDLDGDGDLDLVVNSLGQGTFLFYNDGRGHFTQPLPLVNAGGGGMSLGIGDLDGDGFPDLYIANYRTSAFMDIPNKRATFKRVNGKVELDTLNGRSTQEPDLRDRFVVGPRGSLDELGQVDLVLHNLGGTNFSAIPFTGGSFLDAQGKVLERPPLDWGLSVMVRDFNQDGLPDIYVCNDFQTEDRLWINQGNGRFRLASRDTFRHTSMFSMGIDVADLNHDGFDDVLVLDMLSRGHARRMQDMREVPPVPVLPGDLNTRPQYSLNTLFLNRGDGTFAEVGQLAGLDATDWSWTAIFLDVDLDGWEDLLVSTGMERAARDLDVADQIKALRASRRLTDTEVFEARRRFPKLATGTFAFRNRGDLTFEDTGARWHFQQPGVSQGMALADLDNDGDLDVIVNNLNAAAGIFRNDASAPRIAVQLKGAMPNTRGLGSRITVRGGAVPVQSQEMVAGGRYLSSDQSIRTFAAGSATNRLAIEVRWRSGKVTTFANLIANQFYEIDETGSSTSAPPTPPSRTQPVFEDVSAAITHRHHDDPFDDFARQPLLSSRLSQPGPGVLWFDLDGDGLADLIVGGGTGGSTGAFRNRGGGRFEPFPGGTFTETLARDQMGLVAARLPGTNRSALLLSALANYEDGTTQGGGIRQYDLARNLATEPIAATDASPGPVALGDIDGDGQLELFIGSRVLPGRYPQAGGSRLLKLSNGQWIVDAEASRVFQHAGMVSGAVFTDLDGDGKPDLALACEWGPVRVFWNRDGRFSEATDALGLGRLQGWWNGITAADVDGDGRMDLIASNWGRNTPWESGRSPGHPLRLYHGDVVGDGIHQVLEAYFDTGLNKYVPWRSLPALAKSLPFLSERYPSNQAFSTVGIEEFLAERLANAKVLEATTLESMLFLNRGDHFEARALPIEAQFAPAFGVTAGDFNGDGTIDLVLAQNFFAVQPELPRMDAGLGLLLWGDGTGSFQAVAAAQSGIRGLGEQRGVAAADFDGDGRLDLAIGQNSADTLLLRNRTAQPALRIQLEGAPANPDAIGASMRWVLGGRGTGPRQEIHAGSGYLSQDSPVLLMVPPPRPGSEALELEVRWPDGHLTRTPVVEPAGTLRIAVDGTGSRRP